MLSFAGVLLGAAALGLAPGRAAELRLEFNPARQESWQQLIILDRLTANVFSGVGLAVELVAPGAEERAKLPKERLENLKVHLWVSSKSPELYGRFVRIISVSPYSFPWEEAAALLGLDAAQIQKETSGEQGEELFKAARSTAQPALRLDGRELSASFDLTELAQAINERLPEAERVKMTSVERAQKAKPKVEVLVIQAHQYAAWAKLDDKTLESLKRLPFDVKIKPMDAAKPAARAVLEETGIMLVPAVILKPLEAPAAKELDQFAQRGAVVKKGKDNTLYYVPGFSSSGVFWAKKERPGRNLDLFIMSQCPYGVAAQRVVLSAEKDGKLPKDLKLTLRYIVDKENNAPQGQGAYRSLHGDGELEENIRQMVLQRYMPDNLRCYLSKRLENIQSSLWSDMLEGCGVDLAKFKELYKSKSAELLEEDFRLAESLDVRSSPTFIWRGRYALSGLGSLQNVEEFKDVDFKSAVAGGTPAGKCQ